MLSFIRCIISYSYFIKQKRATKMQLQTKFLDPSAPRSSTVTSATATTCWTPSTIREPPLPCADSL
jgi:hypothetical protein